MIEGSDELARELAEVKRHRVSHWREPRGRLEAIAFEARARETARVLVEQRRAK